MARPSRLPASPSKMVLSVLRKSGAPMSAYQLLAQLRGRGVKSPPIVYRALSALEAEGAVHKINELNAYVACNCGSGHTHDISVLTVCRRCHKVRELHDHAVIDALTTLRKLKVNIPHTAVIELPVECEECGG